MNNIEDRIKKEYQNMKLPETDMAERVKADIRSGKYIGSESRDTGRQYDTIRQGVLRAHPVHFARIAGVAALFALIITCTSASIYAAYKDLTIAQVFTLIWGGDIAESIQNTISCDAGIISEKNGFDNLDIKPVKVIGDVRGLYIIFELKSDDERVCEALDTGRAAFYDYNLEYEESGSSGSSIYMLDKAEDSWYIALKYLGGNDGGLVSDNDNITITLDELYMYDVIEDGEPYIENDSGRKEADRIIAKGSYKAVISYNYISDNVEYIINDCTYNISALTVMVSVKNEQIYYKMLDNNMTIKLKDGSVVNSEFIYGLEHDGGYTAIYNIDYPVDPAEVRECAEAGLDKKGEENEYEKQKDN